MGFPGEDVVSTALEKFGDGLLKKMDEEEERRNREFSYKLKELEFYKGNYDKEIKAVFDGWFDLLKNLMLVNNKNISEEQRNKHKKELNNELKPEKSLNLRINTMKYGGTETGKALAVFSQTTFKSDTDTPQFALVCAICLLLSILKQEILGQEISPNTILQILFNDYFENIQEINIGFQYVEEIKISLMEN